MHFEMVSCAGQQPSCGCRITMTLPQTLRQRVAVSAFCHRPAVPGKMKELEEGAMGSGSWIGGGGSVGGDLWW